MNAHKLTQIAITMACLILAGCASTGAATPTAAQPPQPPITEAATSTPTETLVSTATLAATSTPRRTLAPDQPTQVEPPTPENTLVPTATAYPVPLSPAGPWLLFRGSKDSQSYWDSSYLWAMNQDGTGLTRLSNEPVIAFAVRPTSTVQDGLTIAYVIVGDSEHNPESAIRILSWPDGNVKTIVSQNLIDVGAEAHTAGGLGRQAMAAYQGDGLVWSPSGAKLAFVSAMDDATLNVFVYDVATDQIARISANNDSHDFKLLWSSDERYVIHQGFHWNVMGGDTPLSVWSARADAGGVTQLLGMLENQYPDNAIEYLGWLSPEELIITFDYWIVGETAHHRDIRVINIKTGNYTTLLREPLLDVAYSPEHNLLLMTKNAPAPNTLLISYQNGERREITGYAIKAVEWLSAYNVFLGQTLGGRAYFITPDGTVTEIPSPGWKVESPHRVIASPDGQWWVWHSFGYNDPAELWVGPAMSQPTTLLSFSKAVPDYRVYNGDVKWSPDSQHLLWITRGGLYVASPPGFETTQITDFWRTYPDNKVGDFSDAVWVQ